MAIGSLIAVGFLLGIALKGSFSFNININHKQEQSEQKEIVYNESMADEMDPAIRSYYDQSNGLNKF